jgi:hypothetical protein
VMRNLAEACADRNKASVTRDKGNRT